MSALDGIIKVRKTKYLIEFVNETILFKKLFAFIVSPIITFFFFFWILKSDGITIQLNITSKNDIF